MGQENSKLSVVLVEFDSMKGPVLRKKEPQNFDFPINEENDNILMWILRAVEFSVRKIDTYTAYAKTIALRDPNFSRKKRQFGIAFITKSTIEIEKMERLLENIVEKCQREGENKPYFKMLNSLLKIIEDVNDNTNLLQTTTKDQQETSDRDQEDDAEEIENDSRNNQYLLMSNRLKMFNKVSMTDKRTNKTTIVCAADRFSQMQGKIGQLFEVLSEKFQMEIDIRFEVPEGLNQGMEMMLRIFEVQPIDGSFNERLLVAVEFFDRLLYERVDLEYFLPYLQYFISMENFTITEFKTEEFDIQLPNLMETHGEWINCLANQNLDGKHLTEFYKLTGVRREGLELLIDLLFVKIIVIF
ncbi:MAG: hypothetical protein ACTSSH_11090 [Candidatus Heimdallarchaeota archaeon]